MSLMKEKAIVSTSTLLVSLIAYWYAQSAKRDAVPYVMLGGFIGSIIGEIITNDMTEEHSQP
ncbi:MAG TPA: hypothetical protein VF487_13475 [Chitinophagaceae bacterium]